MYGHFLRHLEIFSGVYFASAYPRALDSSIYVKKFFREKNEVDRTYKPKLFSIKTATGPLRNHLISCHKEDWAETCKKQNITPKAKAAKVALQEYLGEGQDGVTNTITRKPYTHEAFIDAIVDWIVGSDLVSNCSLVVDFYSTSYSLSIRLNHKNCRTFF